MVWPNFAQLTHSIQYDFLIECRVARSLELFSRAFFALRYGQWPEEVWCGPGRLFDCMTPSKF